MAEHTLDVGAIQAFLREFARERDWEQFHSPKNLAAGVMIEAAELMEHFQWSTDEASARVMGEPARADGVREEIADVFCYLLRLADVLSIDLHEAVWAKLEKNAAKYPVHLAKGNSKKYTEFPG